MNAHLLFKFHYYLWQRSTQNTTLEAHKAVIDKYGAVWWGQNSGIAQDKAEAIKLQIKNGQPTFVFLYCINVPKKIHSDGVLWYRAKVLDISLTKPLSVEKIPTYYSEQDQFYSLISDIEEIKYEPGQSPKVPGQTATRHVSLDGKPQPENLVYLNNLRKKICSDMDKRNTKDEISLPVNDTPIPSNDLERIIDLQAEIITLKDEISNLKTYKEYYGKILNTDYLFSSEKFFETWIQENMHRIFPEFEVIDRQPSIAWPDGKFGRLDLLAYNKESRDLVIIEVKTRKRSKHSGYDQFLRYTSWAKRNMPELKKRYPKFDFQIQNNPQFILISDFVNDEMKAICKDHSISLIHIFGGLGVEKF